MADTIFGHTHRFENIIYGRSHIGLAILVIQIKVSSIPC